MDKINLQNYIEEIDQENSSIKWYTKETFIYKIINAILRGDDLQKDF